MPAAAAPMAAARAGSPVLPPGVPVRAPMHPGRFLERHYLKPLALSQSEAARRLGISRRRMHELVSGQRAMSPDTAIRCALAFGLPANAWLALQSDWDCWHAWRELKRQADAAGAPPLAVRSPAGPVPTAPPMPATAGAG